MVSNFSPKQNLEVWGSIPDPPHASKVMPKKGDSGIDLDCHMAFWQERRRGGEEKGLGSSFREQQWNGQSFSCVGVIIQLI